MEITSNEKNKQKASKSINPNHEQANKKNKNKGKESMREL